MTLRFDSHGKPVGLDWDTLSANCPQDPSVWTRASLVKSQRAAGRLPDETETMIVRMHAEGMTAAEIAEAVEVNPMTVGVVLTRRDVTEGRGRGTRQAVSPELEDEIIRLYADENKAAAAIKAEAGVSHQTLYKVLRRRGVPLRGKGVRGIPA